MTQNLVITSSPHFRAKDTTRTIMLDVLIALCPALIASVIWFGPRALLVSAVCVGASVLFEYTYRKLMHLDMTIGDLSAAVTGLLLAFNLPSSIPLWMAVIGCFVSIIIIKQLFGGIGKNFANPAIVGRIVLLISFATPMTNWPVPLGTDAVTGPTPLGMVSAMEAAGVDAASSATPPSLPTYVDMFLGKIGGSLGETCTLADRKSRWPLWERSLCSAGCWVPTPSFTFSQEVSCWELSLWAPTTSPLPPPRPAA